MLTTDAAKAHIDKVLSYSSFPECDIRLDYLERAWLRFALNGVSTSGVTSEQWMTITSTKDGRIGSTTVAEFDDKSLRDAVRHSEELALLSPPNPERVKPLGAQKYPDLENCPERTLAARNDAFVPQ